MKLYEDLLSIKEKMENSPLRKSRDSAPILIEQELFNEDLASLDILIENISAALCVGIIGEVKAGKSTLINALAGRVVTPTNVLEATSSIIKIKYSATEYAKIIYTTGTIEEKENVEVLFQFLTEHANDQLFFSTVQSVEIGIPLNNLRNLILVDTPGLETVTKDNEKRTHDFVKNADLFLWVINGHYLGQADILDTMMEIIKHGKPVVAVLNRIDEIDGDVDRLVTYLEDELGMYVQNIFPFSGYQALQGILENNNNKIDESGYYTLLNYLDERINQKVDEVKVKSTLSATQTLIHRDIVKHEEILNTMKFVEDQIEKVERIVEEYSDKTGNVIQHAFDNWYSYRFLESEKKELMDVVQTGNIFSNKKMKENLNVALQNFLSNERIDQQLTLQVQELNEIFKIEWDKALHKLKEEILIDFNDFSVAGQKRLTLQLSNTDKLHIEGSVLSGAATGAWIGGAAGASAAFYAAALGPAASYVTIGMAASAFLPPFLLIGASIGFTNKLLKTKKEKNLVEMNVSELIESYKKENKLQISNHVLKIFKERAELVSRNVLEELTRSFCNQQSKDELMVYKKTLTEYIMKMKKLQELLFVQTIVQ
ncbi:dynamin family protein [Fictibacillus sp. B-59209]|uniref:dynamin family protein n=1 Tax=Fictibacillus sp. B-59209 TaxID=3024873 RepID=UPI002E1C22BB|nr:dynamin family protein [Fictibacillus sp. B-59209]